MASRRNEILKGLKAGLETITGMTADRVVIGVIRPDKAEIKPKVMVWWRSDRGERKDGNKTSRTLTLVVGVLGKLDKGSNESQLLQISTIYDEVHAKMEALAETPIGTTGQKGLSGMKETASGIEPSGFDDGDSEYYIACEWEMKYERTRGATA